jgi:hypothetical protein
MTKHRAHTEGTVYQRPDGRWCAQVSLDGRRLTRYARTQRQCREWLKTTLAQVDDGLTVEGARASLGEYLEKWLEKVRASGLRRPLPTISSGILLVLPLHLGEPHRTRTCNPLIKSQLLYQLS